MPDIMPALKPELEGKSPAELDMMMREIISRANGNFDDLSEDDLHMIAAITGSLRRKSAGPPKEKKAPKGKKASTDDLLDLV